MKRTLLSVKELAVELGMSPDSVYRAYRKVEIPAAQICRTLRFDLRKVQRAMEKKAKAMAYRRRPSGAPGGASRPRGRKRSQKAPELVTRGRS